MNFRSMQLKRSTRNTIAVVFLLALIYLIGYFFISKNYVPPGFIESRQSSAVIAKDIVTLIEESIKNLDKIAFYDRQYNFQKALDLVREEMARAAKSRFKAVELTKGLDRMARAASGVTPAKARNLAVEAISNELSLISHLIVYNDILNSLLQTLEFKFSGDIRYDAQEVQALIKNMNSEAQEINKLNESFNQRMKELDSMMSSA